MLVSSQVKLELSRLLQFVTQEITQLFLHWQRVYYVRWVLIERSYIHQGRRFSKMSSPRVSPSGSGIQLTRIGLPPSSGWTTRSSRNFSLSSLSSLGPWRPQHRTMMLTISATVNAIESCNFPATAYTLLSCLPLPSLLPSLLLRLCELASSQKVLSCLCHFPCQARTSPPRFNSDSKTFVMLLDGPWSWRCWQVDDLLPVNCGRLRPSRCYSLQPRTPEGFH